MKKIKDINVLPERFKVTNLEHQILLRNPIQLRETYLYLNDKTRDKKII